MRDFKGDSVFFLVFFKALSFASASCERLKHNSDRRYRSCHFTRRSRGVHGLNAAKSKDKWIP